MNNYIKIGDKLIPIIACYAGERNTLGSKREALEIILEASYDFVVETFVNNLEYSIVQIEEDYEDEDGNLIKGETFEFDKTEYCLSGSITDNRDGTCNVIMGMKTDLEEVLIALYGGVE